MAVGAITPNNSYESNSWMAQNAAINRKLDEMAKKAGQAASGHIVASQATDKADKELKEACQGFEAMFLDIMYRQMKKTVPESNFFGKSNAMDIFEDMRDSEMMKNVAVGGGLGVGDMLYRQLAPTVLAQTLADAETGNK